MVKTSLLSAATALLALTSAMPMEKRGTTITQSPTGQKGLSGQAAWLKALHKFHAKSDAIGKVLINPSSVTANSISNDLEYLCPVKIGSTTFQLDFDTGSSDLWVFGANAGASGHAIYRPSSSAHKLSGATWQIQYGDGSSASGDVYTDTVTIGGTVVKGQAVERATQAADSFIQGAGDGLVGLAFDSINTVQPNQQQTFFSNAISQGLQPVLAADLRKNEAGSYTFGEIPSGWNPTYTNVDNSQGFWMFTPDSSNLQSSSDLTGICDTGTTLLLLQSDQAQAYYQNVQGADNSQGQWSVDCNADLPDFSISVNGYTATVPGSYINYADNGDGTCYGGIQEATGLGFNIYGDIFIKSQNVVFDMSVPQIGFSSK